MPRKNIGVQRNLPWFRDKVNKYENSLEPLSFAVSSVANVIEVPEAIFSAPLFNPGERYYAFVNSEDRDNFLTEWSDARTAERSEFM